MAFVSSSFSNRKLQGRRFTLATVSDSVEAFTSTIDTQGFEVLTDDRYIPTGSAGNEQIPFSGSSQHDYYYTTGSTIETSAGNYDVLRYYYRHKLTRGADGSGEVYFFQSGEPSSPTDLYGNNQTISTTQQTDFISNKNAAGSLGAGDAEDSAGLGVAYNAVVYSSTDADKANLTTGDKIDPANYVFDYKTGVLTFTEGNEVAGSNYVFITVNQYVGRTLKSQLNDGSLGGDSGVSSFNDLTDVPSGLLSGSSFSSTAQGTLSASINGVATIVALGLKTTDDVTFNTVNASTINADIIEASEYIVSSSITYMTQSFSSGSTIFGDSIDDTHIFTGSLKLTGSLIADIPTTATSERTPLVIDSNGNITISDADYITAADAEIYVLDITSSGDDSKISITNSEGLIISGAGGLDVTSATNTLTFTIGNGILSSSAQIDTEISGAFTAASASFSTRVTDNDAKVSYTDAAVTSVINTAGVISGSAQIATEISGAFTAASGGFSTRVTANESAITTLQGNEIHTAVAISGSTRIYVSGSNGGFDVGQDSTLKFVSGTAGITVLSSSNNTITIGASTDDVEFSTVTATTFTGTSTQINLSDVGGGNEELPFILSKEPTPNNTIGYRISGIKFTYNPGLGEIKIGGSGLQTTYGYSEIQGGSGLALDRFRFHTDESAVQLVEIGSSTSDVVIGNTLFISGSSISTDETSFNLLNDTATTINFGSAATTLNIGNANGTVKIAGSASIAGDLIVQGTVTSIQTENLNVSDQFILLASGSAGTKDGGIIVQSGSNGVGTALYFDANANRWAVNPANSVNWNDTSLTPKQYVVSVSASAAAPPTDPLDFGNTNEYYGMMHVNTDNGDIYIYS